MKQARNFPLVRYLFFLWIGMTNGSFHNLGTVPKTVICQKICIRKKKKKPVGRLTGSQALLISKPRSNDSTTEKVSKMEDNIAFKFSMELTQGGGSDKKEGKE